MVGCGSYEAGFWCPKIFLVIEIYFLGGWSKGKGSDESEDTNFVAAPFGLRCALRASLRPSVERNTPFGVSFSWG